MAELVIYSDILPESPSAGKIWIQPSTGQVRAYLNNRWAPITGGDGFSFIDPLSIIINGEDRTYNIEGKSLKIKNNLTERVDVSSFNFFDFGNTSIRPIEGQEISIYDVNENIKIFGGEITKITSIEEAPGIGTFIHKCSCIDFTKKLTSKLVVEIYENQTAGDIIKDIIDNNAPEYTYFNVQDGPEITYISFNYTTISQCIKELATLTGYSWYVDSVKDIHFFSKETNIAPYSIDDDVDVSGNFKKFSVTRDKSQYRNSIILQGGFYLSQYDVDIRVADGQATAFTLNYEPFGTVRAYVDIGAGFVEKTVGEDDSDESGFDFVVNQEEKLIKNLDLATLSNGYKLKVTYERKIQVLASGQDQSSIDRIKAIEGGDGIYEYPIKDSTIETIEAANLRIDAELSDYANTKITGSFVTDQYGYRSGQLLTVNRPNLGLNNETYLIYSVAYSKIENKYVEWTINFATKFEGLTEFLLKLNEKDKQIEISSNEVIHISNKYTQDSVLFDTETVTWELNNP